MSTSLARLMVEACVDSVALALAAEQAGAGRIEICGPGVGGTTPSYGLMSRCRERLRIPLHVMIRPREGNFVYDDDEFEIMLYDVGAARSARVDGVVFGILTPDGQLDEPRMQRLAEAALPMRIVCHRAFDVTPDADAALDVLQHLGFDAVLTSGHAPTAMEGRAQLSSHVRRTSDKMRIIAGGNVRASNVLEIVTGTNVRDVHVRATDATIFAGVTHMLGRDCRPDA